MYYSTINFAVRIPDQPMVFSADSLYHRLQELEDKRDCRGRLYELAPILFIALLAKLMGQNQLGAVAEWAKLRYKELNELLGLKGGRMPHKTTWGRILGAAVSAAELEALMTQFLAEQMKAQIPERGSLLVNLDGKTLRGTIPKGRTTGVHLLALFVPK